MVLDFILFLFVLCFFLTMLLETGDSFCVISETARPSVSFHHNNRRCRTASVASLTAAQSFMDTLSAAATEALGHGVQFKPTSGGGASGGGGATTSAVVDEISGLKYFVKSAGIGKKDMLQAEYLGCREMANTNTIKVPTPIAHGQYPQASRSFVIFEWLEFCRGTSQYTMGQQLAKMHRCMSPNGQFGFMVNNTIGATPQPNLPWVDNWADFWDEHRLCHMLKLTNNARSTNSEVQELRDKTRTLLSQHGPLPSLLHGDIWCGNKGFVKNVDDGRPVPCIFDPATYYGDRETDIAMTYLFGGFTSDFYRGYEDEWPLPDGHQQRRQIYNLYHILNHQVLFGGGYARQARSMIRDILRMKV